MYTTWKRGQLTDRPQVGDVLLQGQPGRRRFEGDIIPSAQEEPSVLSFGRGFVEVAGLAEVMFTAGPGRL
jgi:hypothetical protein